MVTNIYSKNGDLLQIINRHSTEETNTGRINLSPENELLQVSIKNEADRNYYRPHYHLEQERITTETQESWIVIKGSIEAEIYDYDNELLSKEILGPSDCVITFRGGHSYRVLEEGTVVYEIKNGPYYGQTKDKEWLDENPSS